MKRGLGKLGLSMLGLAALLAVIAVGCGGGDDSTQDTASGSTNETSSTSQGESSNLSGDPVKVMVIAAGGTATINVDQMADAGMATADAINAEGGVSGRPLEVVYCNPRQDPNLADACARRAVSEDAIAAIYYLSTASAVTEILGDADISAVNFPTTESDYEAPNSFPMTGGLLSTFYAQPKVLQEQGAEKQALMTYNASDGATAVEFFTEGAEAIGADITKIERFDPGIPDTTPQVSAVLDSGAEGIVSGIAAADGTKVLQAIYQSGETPVITSPGNPYTAETLETLGPAGEGLYLISGFPPGDAEAAVNKQATEDFENYGDGIPVEDYTLVTWVGIRTLVHAAEEVKAVDGPSVLKAMNKLTNWSVGPLQNYTTTGKPPLPDLPRVRNPNVYVAQNNAGTRELVNEKPINPFE